ncbi:MAG: HAD family hydrolase, partial [candidate division Zixibacteria bacterium]|nr:HAD family hydrolase [candidate division Zixibacteria bacterium]
MEKLKPRAVIFDLGSTLIEYEAIPWEELNKLCAAASRKFLLKSGYAVPDEAEFFAALESAKSGYRKLADDELIEWDVVQAARTLFARMGWESNNGLAEKFFDAYYAPVDKQLYVYEDTIATLTRLRSQIKSIGLISNTVFPERAHHHELKRFGVAPFLDFSIFSSTFKLRKPHPDIFYKAANLAGVAPGECVYIGDRYKEDIVGPTAIGMPAILKVKEGRAYPEEMPALSRRIDHLSELFEH